MYKKSIAFLTAIIMLVSVFVPQLNVNAADSSIADSGVKIHSNNGNTSISSNTTYSSSAVTTGTTTSTAINMAIGTATGTVGDTVTVPITFSNVVNAGNVAVCSLYIGYDTSLLEATVVTAGALVLNPEVNLLSVIHTNNGSIAFLFCDDTMGSELIKTDGVFAYITFKLKSTTADVITPVVFNKGGVFCDRNSIKIASGDRNNGSITIKASTPQ